MPRIGRTIALGLVCAMAVLACAIGARAQVTTINGTLPDGATYVFDVPANWNGILLLYSHGYVPPGNPNPAQDVGDPLTGAFLLSQGFALAGSSYATTGWAIHEAIPDQLATLTAFATTVGPPGATIAWGHSLGGIITAGLVQTNPTLFAAALPMCGVLSGGVGTWNQGLDSAVAFNTLIAGGALQVTNITNPVNNLVTSEAFLASAASTPQGLARIALVAALGDTPGWFDPLSPAPAPTDYLSQAVNQAQWMGNVTFPFAFALRAELEARAGGNPSSNVGVDYRKQLHKSVNAAEVETLYAATGLDLNADLATLNSTPRITADPGALSYLEQNIIFNGTISIPVLSMHTTGDGLVVVENENAWWRVLTAAGDNSMAHEIFVNRAGHCTFTPAETITALGTLAERVIFGRWRLTGSSFLNAEANLLGPTFNVFPSGTTLVATPPAFLDYTPPEFLRRFDTFVQQ